MWKQFENTDCPTKLRGSPRYSDRLSHTHTAPHQRKLKPSCRCVFRVYNAGTASTGKATMSSDSSEPLQFDIEVSTTEGNREAATVAKSPPPCPAGALETSVTNDASGVQNPGLEFFSDLLNANTIPTQPLEHDGTDTGGASKEPGCLSEIWYGAPPPPVSVVEACDEATRREDDAERCGPDVRGDAECAWTGAAGDSDADADPGEGSMPPAPSCISRCSKHGAHLRVYCADDGQVMCVRCQISMRHNGHRILSDVEAAETMQASHHDWLEKLTKRKEGNMQMIEAIKKTSTEAAAFKAIQESLKGAEKEPPDITQSPNNGLQAVFESEAKISKLLKAFEPKLTEVTLDPETAHPNLEISADGAEVRCVRRRRDVPEEPGRFLSTLNVLACRGLPALTHRGCCYWEVVVAGKTGWTVGMAYASVPRVDCSRLGRNSGSWALELHNGVYTAWHGGVAEPPLALAVPKPTVVGVLLVEGAGTLAFFDAASMALLHAFHARFLEPLYPALNPHSCREQRNTAPLRLVEPDRAQHSDSAATATTAAAATKPSFKLVLSGLFS
ncbi:E3 ubiquitin-protein ligase TRIM7-like isoform X4 [Lethenteron reissneri]|uniref:E3 ubiquitin-protein ligase TRIM7-like isoform X4 n=1 Tax=Lethenteron reissneri TaxID=7753 RepID=UPI002AB6C017|nr:E3 ubiquitin-protein ligase TRIM7-like isoform X4 [Lethenteron reissneri]